MHEMSIAQNIVEIVDDASGGKPDIVEQVFVDVGTLVAVVPDSLEFCYSAITAGTPLEQSRIVIRVIPVRVHCAECDRTSEVESFVFRCPGCDGTSLQVLSGNELSVTEIEVT
jgi:hydrogenase nickel incorporation protein HypA/HybF